MKAVEFDLVLCDPPLGLTLDWWREHNGSWDFYPVYSGVRNSTGPVLVGLFSWLRNPA